MRWLLPLVLALVGLRCAHAPETAAPSSQPTAAVDWPEPQPPALRLTEREQQTLRLIANGHSNKGVARELDAGFAHEQLTEELRALRDQVRAVLAA